MELLVKVADAKADFVLELLGKYDFVEVEKHQTVLKQSGLAEQHPEFSALKLKTKGWKFNREEANER